MSAERELLRRLIAWTDTSAEAYSDDGWKKLDAICRDARALLAQSPECCPTCSAGLERYAQHLPMCTAMDVLPSNGRRDAPCSCGYRLALKTSLAEEGEKACLNWPVNMSAPCACSTCKAQLWKEP